MIVLIKKLKSNVFLAKYFNWIDKKEEKIDYFYEYPNRIKLCRAFAKLTVFCLLGFFGGSMAVYFIDKIIGTEFYFPLFLELLTAPLIYGMMIFFFLSIFLLLNLTNPIYSQQAGKFFHNFISERDRLYEENRSTGEIEEKIKSNLQSGDFKTLTDD